MVDSIDVNFLPHCTIVLQDNTFEGKWVKGSVLLITTAHELVIITKKFN